MVIDAAEPPSQLEPAEATQEAPTSAIEAVRVGPGSPMTIIP